MSKIEFPNEPIRFPAEPQYDPRYDEQMDAWTDERERCNRCGGDGWIICDGGVDCPEADDAGCPFIDFHTYCCWDCGGEGSFKIKTDNAQSDDRFHDAPELADGSAPARPRRKKGA